MLTVQHSTIRLVRRLVGAHPHLIALTVLALFLGGLADGISIAMLLPLVNQFIGDADTDNVIVQTAHQMFTALNITPGVGPFLVVIVLAVTLNSLFSLLAKLQIGYVTARYGAELRHAIIRSVMGARWQHFVQLQSGRLASAIGTEVQQAAGSYIALSKVVAAAMQSAIQLAVAFIVSWQMAMGAIIFGVLLMLLAAKLVSYSRVVSKRRRDAIEMLMSRLLEGLGGIKSLKGMGAERRIVPLLRWEVDQIKSATAHTVALTELVQVIPRPLTALCVAVALYFYVTHWNGPFDSFLVLALLFVRTSQSLSQLQVGYQRLISCEPSYWFVHDVIAKAEADKEELTGNRACRLTRSIEFRDVGFGYGGKAVLQGVNATIKAGEFAAVVGRSGEGKTTLVDLVIGLLKPDSGVVLVDGVSLSDADMKQWRSHIGYVLQETFLFHGSILENVTFGDPELDESDATEALRAAGAWDFVMALPDGLHTVVGEKGGRLSGGQRQRIAIARALVRKPDLLILDEPTTALDQEAEENICRTLSSLAGQLTILAISHQPALTRAAHRVFRMSEGRLHEDRPSLSVDSREPLAPEQSVSP